MSTHSPLKNSSWIVRTNSPLQQWKINILIHALSYLTLFTLWSPHLTGEGSKLTSLQLPSNSLAQQLFARIVYIPLSEVLHLCICHPQKVEVDVTQICRLSVLLASVSHTPTSNWWFLQPVTKNKLNMGINLFFSSNVQHKKLIALPWQILKNLNPPFSLWPWYCPSLNKPEPYLLHTVKSGIHYLIRII